MANFKVGIIAGCLLYGTAWSMEQQIFIVFDEMGRLKREAAAGDVEAQYSLAMRYESGEGVERSSAEAKKLYQKAADQGYVHALYRLGKMAQRAKDFGAAAHYYARAAELQNEPLSQYELAMMNSENGWGAEKSPEKEREWLEKLVSNLFTGLAPLADEQYQSTVKIVQARAAYRLGEMHEEGLAGLDRSYIRAAEFYKKSLECKVLDKTLYRLASLYLRGAGIAKNVPEAKRLLLSAPETYAPAQCLLGDLYRAENEWTLAVSYYRKVQQESPEAQYYLGIACEQGWGTKKDPANALALFVQSAEQGCVLATNKLRPLLEGNPAIQCLFGRLCRPRDESAAIAWFRKALKGNSPQALDELLDMAKKSRAAQYALGELHSKGQGVAASVTKAVEWYEKAALQNDERALEALKKLSDADKIEAIMVLARFCEMGQAGCPQDLQTALEWYRKAVDSGSGEAALYIAESYETGCLGKKDESSAIEWLARAAELKSERALTRLVELARSKSHAQFVLGQVLVHGIAKERDLATAQGYFSRAARQGHMGACCALARLLEERPSKDIVLSDEVFARYQEILELYKKAADGRYGDAHERMERIIRIMDGLRAVEKEYGKPDFKNFLFLKLRTRFSSECSPELLYYAAHIAGIVHNRHSDTIQETVFRALEAIASFASQDELTRAVVKALVQIVHSQEFENNQIDEVADSQRLTDLFRLRRGLSLLQGCNKDFATKVSFVMAEDTVRDPRITVFNCLFKAALLGSWAVAGNHCSTRAEEETYKFFLLNMTSARSLDKHNLSFEMRVAILLAELRKKCLEDLVPSTVSEYIHQRAYLEKKARRLLELIGDAESFNDRYVWVVAEKYKEMTSEDIEREVLKRYTVAAMVAVIMKELNQKNDSRIPYSCVSRYLESVLGSARAAVELLGKLCDDEGCFTEAGVKILLCNLGYLE